MKLTPSLKVASFGCLLQSVSSACPGSEAYIHASCDMTITFPDTDCSTIQEEIALRMAGSDEWVDPHNGGVYTLESQTSELMTGNRLTGNRKYTDLFELSFVQDGTYGSCVVQACSESQVTSVFDFSTNYCNLHNLYCSESQEGCPTIKYNFTYEEYYGKCRYRDVSQCLSSLAKNR